MRVDKNDMTCIKVDIDENTFLYTKCKTSVGELEEVLICRDGIYISLDELTYDIRVTCRRLREILKTQYIYVYVKDYGYYDYFSDRYKEMDFDNFFDEIFNELYSYTDEEMCFIEKRLRIEDAQIRGSYVDDEDNVFIRKGSQFRQVSDLDSDMLYYLCLFGGSFGLHRFWLRKYFTGLIYLLTLGFFGAGWIGDLLSIYLGNQLDKKKRILLPVENKKHKLIWLAAGIVINVIYLKIFLELLSSV